MQANAHLAARGAVYRPQLSFASFWRDWADYVLELNEMTEQEAEAGYAAAMEQTLQLRDRPLWRGMSVASDWLNSGAHARAPVGLFWSEDASVAQTFQSAASVYDERFLQLKGVNRPGRVLLKARAPLESIDLAATIATQLASAEAEVRLVAGSTLHLLEMRFNDIPVTLNGMSAVA